MGGPRERAVEAGEAPLALVPLSVVARALAGIALCVAWTRLAVMPLLCAVETDVSPGALVALHLVAIATPAFLFVRRHALAASVRWDEHGVTRLVAGHVATAIRWEDALARVRMASGEWLLEITDASGRRISVVTGALFGAGDAGVGGRCHLAPAQFDSLLAFAKTRVSRVSAITGHRASAWIATGVLVALVGSCMSFILGERVAPAFALVCVLLVWGPWRRLCATLRKPRALEALLLDTEERGRLRARRLDGSAVLLDVSPASHPDAMLAMRRGFVNAVLDVPSRGGAPSYRATETPIAATYVETRDDRVLRFESLRAALVDVIGYGAFLASSVAALLVGV